MVLPYIVSLLALVPLALAQNKTQLCSWLLARGGVVRDSLYLEGGLRYMGDLSSSNTLVDCQSINVQDGVLLRFNFSKSFDVNNLNFSYLFEPVSENIGNIAPYFISGGMFADDDEFYTIGGLAYLQHSNTTDVEGSVYAGLYQPNAQATSFAPSVTAGYRLPSDISQYITHGAGVSIPSENLGFYFSGLSTGNNSPLDWNALEGSSNKPDTLVSTILKVDTSSASKAGWNQTQIPSDIARRAGASMAWIPAGAQGALVVIGGTIHPGELHDYILSDDQTSDNSNSTSFITTIPVFDIASSTWYSVNTTGTTPGPLVDACAVVASAADGSSHQIYVYGGYDGTNAFDNQGSSLPPYDEVWILSVPSFEWIKASSGSSDHGRFGHTCAKPYPNQMIVVGGVGGGGTSLTTKAVVDNFDLNNLTWTGKYDPTEYANYSVPSNVTDVIGGNADGGATLFASNMNSALSSVFRTRYTKSMSTWYPYAPEPTATSVPAKHKSVAVPVAVSVVVVVVVLVTALIAWFCFCSPTARKKRSEKASDDSTRVSNNFIHNWVSNSAQFVPPPKSVISSDATEIGESLSPRAEVAAGFSYFTPHVRSGFPAEADGVPLHGQNTAGAPHNRAASPSSPGSHGSAELEGVPTPPQGMSEILNNQRNTEVFRNHPIYPPSLGGQSNGSGPLASRFANARAPSDTATNAVELPPNRSTENVGLVVPQGDLNRSKSDKSHTETSTDISAPTDSDADARMTANQSSSGVRTPDLVPHQPLPSKEVSSKQQAGKSYPPTALSNIASQAHHRSTSSASSGMAITLSPSTSDNYTNVSPGEDQRRSDYISLLPEHVSRNVVADAEKDKANGSSQQ